MCRVLFTMCFVKNINLKIFQLKHLSQSFTPNTLISGMDRRALELKAHVGNKAKRGGAELCFKNLFSDLFIFSSDGFIYGTVSDVLIRNNDKIIHNIRLSQFPGPLYAIIMNPYYFDYFYFKKNFFDKIKNLDFAYIPRL